MTIVQSGRKDAHADDADKPDDSPPARRAGGALSRARGAGRRRRNATPMRRCATRCGRSPRACTRSASRKGDKVAILMGNKPEWIIADLAICLIGGIMVAVNTWVTRRELQHILAHSDSTLLIASDRYLKYDYFAMLERARAARAVDAAAAAASCMSARAAIATRSRSSDVFARGRDVADAVDRRGAATRSTRTTSPISSTPPARPRRRRACSCSTTR